MITAKLYLAALLEYLVIYMLGGPLSLNIPCPFEKDVVRECLEIIHHLQES